MRYENLNNAVTEWAHSTLEDWLQGYHHGPESGDTYRVRNLGDNQFKVTRDFFNPAPVERRFVVAVTVTEIL